MKIKINKINTKKNMSLQLQINELSDEIKYKIDNELQIENPTKKNWIYPYHIDNNTVNIPFAYGIELGFKPKQRTESIIANINFTGILRDYQSEIKKEAINYLNKYNSCILSLHVGWGKSLFSIYLASKLSLKTLILSSRTTTIPQWIDTIKNITTNKFQLIKNPKMELDSKCDFFIMNPANVHKFPPYFFSTIGTLICDELHLICAELMYKSLFYIQPRYILGLSATPYRPDGLDKLISLYFGSNKIIKLLNRKHTVYAIQTGYKLPFTYNYEGKMDWNSLLNSQAEHPERNNMIVNIIKEYKNRYFLVLCKRIIQGEIIVKLLKDNGEYVTDLLKTKKTFDSEARIVVATSQKCGVGFSHEKLDALILASDIEEYFIQYLGRVFRTPEVEPIIFDIIDDNGILQKHFQTRKNVYKNSGGIIYNKNNKINKLIN